MQSQSERGNKTFISQAVFESEICEEEQLRKIVKKKSSDLDGAAGLMSYEYWRKSTQDIKYSSHANTVGISPSKPIGESLLKDWIFLVTTGLR